MRMVIAAVTEGRWRYALSRHGKQRGIGGE